jgi:hypothetical protein
MGSGLNLLLSMVSLLLYLVKPKGLFLAMLNCAAFWYYDMLTYVIFPQWFALGHLIFWGGTQPGPIIVLR